MTDLFMVGLIYERRKLRLIQRHIRKATCAPEIMKCIIREVYHLCYYCFCIDKQNRELFWRPFLHRTINWIQLGIYSCYKYQEKNN